MKEAIQSTYGDARAKKFFSLADYYKKEGEEKGLKEGEQKRNKEIARQMLVDGESTEKVSKYTGLSVPEVEALVPKK